VVSGVVAALLFLPNPGLFLEESLTPGGCAPRAAIPLAQPRASYVSLSGPFIPREVGWLLGRTVVATSAPPEVTHFAGEV
jgi:hypothetical protein